MKSKNKFILEYRMNGNWFELRRFATKKAANDYAKTSSSAQRHGYQVRKI